MSKHIIIIGGGPAGIEAARAATTAGAAVTLVSESPIGGRSGWSSLLPSKVWLSAADTAGMIAESPFSEKQSTPSPEKILSRLQKIKEQWNSQQADELKRVGAKIVLGLATFQSAKSVLVSDTDGNHITTLSGDAIILATGSVPFFPPNLKPDGQKIIAPRLMSGLKKLPKSISVVGAGATGTEVVYLFNRLGVEVNWIVDKFGVLPGYSPDAGTLMAEILEKRGVKVVNVDLAAHFEHEDESVSIVMSDGSKVTSEMVFLAIGRLADIQRVNPSAAGLKIGDRKYPEIDAFCQTNVSSIYAVGDVAGPPMVANRAMAMARVAGLHASGAQVKPFNPNAVVAAVYSEPQAAQVGVVASKDGSIHTKRLSFGAVMKSHILSETEGFVELAYNKSGTITGGVAVGPHAGDVLAPIALAIQVGAKLEDLAPIFAAHPTFSELAFAAAR